MHDLIASGWHLGGITQVILHIAVSETEIRYNISFKFIEYLLVSLSHNIGQHIQASPVSHTHNYFFNPNRYCRLDRRIQSRNRCLTPF